MTPRVDLPPAPEVVDLGCGERLDLDLRELLVDPPDHLFEVLELPRRVMAADDVYLADVVIHLGEDVLDGHLIGVGLARLLGEVAELARQHADIGRVDVSVEHEVDAVARDLALGMIGDPAQGREIVRCQHRDAVAQAEAFASPDLLPDRREAPVLENDLPYFQYSFHLRSTFSTISGLITRGAG